MTDDDFTEAGVTYSMVFLWLYTTVDSSDPSLNSVQLEMGIRPGLSTRLKSMTLHVGSSSFALGGSVYDSGTSSSRDWANPGLTWTEGTPVTIRLTRANVAPTAANSEVVTLKNNAYTFTASDFRFSDVDAEHGQSLQSVRIVTLPASGKGTLTLGGTAVTAGQSVTKADIDAGRLTYTPPTGESGDDLASFTFKVSDGTAESASASTMTVDVPELSISVNNATIAEAGGASTVTLSTGTGPTFPSDQTIALSLGGTATKTDDYTVSSESLTLTGGASSVTATVTAVQDAVDEENETVTVTATSGGATIGAVTVTITDDDATPTVMLVLADGSIREADDPGTADAEEHRTTATATLSHPSSEATTVTIAPVAGAFTVSGALTIPAGETSSDGSVTLTAVDNATDAPATEVTVAATAANDLGATDPAGATLTITDDDPAPVVTLVLTPAAIDESDDSGTTGTEEHRTMVTATLDRPSSEPTTVTVSAAAVTPAAAGDFTLSGSELTIDAGETSSTGTVTITAVDNNIDAANKTVRVSATAANDQGKADPAAVTLTIVDDDAPPTPLVEVDPASVGENAGTATVTVTTGTGSTYATDQAVTLTIAGTATQHDDFTIGSTTLTLPAGTGTTPSEVTTTVTAVQDRIDDDAETVVVSAAVGTTAIGSATVTIDDDDEAPVLTFAVTETSIGEAAGTSTLTVGTGTGSTFATERTIALSLAGTATRNDDFTIGLASLTLRAGIGTAASSVNTIVTAVQDRIHEGNETILVDAALGTGEGAPAVGARQSVVIEDDDPEPQPTFTVSRETIGEGAETSTVRVSTGTGSTFAADRTVTLTLAAEGTATEHDDFRIGSKSLTLPAGVGTTPSEITTVVAAVQDRIDEADEETILVDAAIGTDAVGSRRTVAVADDDDPPVLEFRASATQIAENGGVSTLTITTGTGSTYEATRTVTVSAADGTALEGSDYEVGETALTLPAGSGLDPSAVTTTVTGLDDANYEGLTDQTLSVSAAHTGSAIGQPITIALDDDEAPSQTVLVLTPATISENEGRSVLTATVSPPSEVGFWLKTEFSGPTERVTWRAPYGNENYGYLEFKAGATVSGPRVNNFSITGIDDEEANGDVRINVTAEVIGFDTGEFRDLPNPLPGIQAPAAATLTVEDDDSEETTVTLSVDVDEVGEGADPTGITVTGTLAGETPTAAVEVTLSVESGTGADGAAGGADFAPVEEFGLTIPVGQASATASFTLTPIEDTVDEPAETLTLSGATEASGVGIAGAVTLSLTDNDDAPSLALSVEPDTIAEDGGTATVSVSTGSGSTYAGPRTVTLALTGTATRGSDYTVGSTSLVLPAGIGTEASSITTTLRGVDDEAADPGETVVVTGSVDGTAFGDAQTVTIDDDEGAPRVTLLLTPEAVLEGGSATVTAEVAPAPDEPFTLTVTAEAGAGADAGDFTLSGTTLSFAAGAARSTGTVTIEATDDNHDDGDRTVTVSGAVSAAGVRAPPDVELALTDDDEAPSLVLDVDPLAVREDGGTATVRVTTGVGSTFETEKTVTLGLAGTAVLDEDYTLSSATLTLPAGEGFEPSQATAKIAALDDERPEGDETVVVTGTVDGEAFGEARTLVIADNEGAPRVRLLLSTASVSENGGVATVTATVSPASPDPFTVTLTATPEDPAGPEDFVLEGTLLSFAAASTESTGEVSVTAVDNDEDAPDRTVTVSGTVSLGTVTAPLPVTLTITDDDAPDPPDDETPVVTLVLTPPSIAENGGGATVTATVFPASPEPFTVTLTAAPEDPAGPEDFVLEGTLLSFAAAATESTGEVSVTAVDNDEDAPDRTVTVSGTVSLGTVTAPLPVTLTITDDDEPAVTLVLTPPSIAENGGVSTVTATVFPASPEPFTVTLTAAPEDPAGPEDFVLEGTLLSFAAAATESTGEVSVTAVDNDEDAPDRTVTVSGTVSLGTVTAPLPVTLTITDDDEGTPPVERGVDIFPTELTIGEGDEAGGTFSVTLTAEPSEPVTVTVFVPAASNLIVDPSEFVFTPADWNIPQTVKVTAPEDDDDEPRTVRLSYSATGSGYDDVPVTDVDVTVTDRIDPGRPELRIADARGPEAGGALLFELTLSHAAEGPVTVEYATRDGTARAGEDYEAIQGTATVAPGEVGTRIAVPLHIDVFREPDESFLLELSGADGARLADDGEATGVIEDEARMASEWLARLGRLVGQDVMAAVEERITAPRAAGSELTVAGLRLAGGETPFGRDGTQLEPSGQAGPGSAPPAAWTALNSWNAATSLWPAARPGEGPGGGGGIGVLAASALGFPGAGGLGGSTALGAGLRALGAGTSGGADLLANSAFRLDTGPGGGRGPALWGRGAYTRFEPFGDGLQTGGKALSATLGADVAWSWGLVGLAASHTAADASYGVAGQTAGALAATLTGLYPYFGLQLGERITVWGLAGRGRGEQIVTPEAGGDGPAPVTLENDLAGLGARAELVAAERGFSLAMKTDALLSRARTVEGQGLLPAEGEWRRVRVGLESAWVAEFDDGAALRSSIEAAALEDAGDAENGLGAQVGASLRFVDVAPGLSLTLAARGLVSHEVEDYEEWSASGGIRYDPEPSSPAGPQVSLTHAWGTEAGGALPRAPGLDGLPRPAPIPGASGDGRLGAALAWGFGAFGGVAVPWAEVALSGDERDYRLGYRLLTPGGVPSLEVGTSAYGLQYSAGWEFTFRCRAHLAIHVRRTGAGLEGPEGTGFTLRLRALGPQATSCRTPEPPLTSAAPF